MKRAEEWIINSERKKGGERKVNQCSETFQSKAQTHRENTCRYNWWKEAKRQKLVTSMRSLSDLDQDWRGHSGLVFGGGWTTAECPCRWNTAPTLFMYFFTHSSVFNRTRSVKVGAKSNPSFFVFSISLSSTAKVNFFTRYLMSSVETIRPCLQVRLV